MEAAVSAESVRPAWLGLRVGARLPSTGVWILGFAPVLYLALQGGGYDLVIYSQVGVAVWWIVLCGVLAGVLPVLSIPRAGWLVLGVLFSYGAWTALGVTWSESVERSVDELGRVSAYAGFFVLGLCVLDAHRLRHLLNGMACAFAIVGVLAVLSRLDPQWFPRDEVVAFFGSTARLDYPLNYANGLGEFLAMGLPLLLGAATRARTLAAGALAAGSLPVLALGIVLSISRGGALAGAIGLLLLLALLPERIPALASALTAAAGSAILIAALLERSALRNGLSTPAAVTQRGQMLVLILVVCAGVALVQAAISLWARFATRPAWMAVPRRRAAIGCAAAAAIAVALALAAGLPGALSRQWRAFEQPNLTGVSASNAYARFGTVTGSHRYQYWQAAVAAFHSSELHGIGPGTFEFWWAQHNSVSQFVRNAHSLYVETLAELGIVGALQVLGLFGILLVLGTVRALRAPPSTRHALAVAVAAFAVFAISAAYDWVWQLAVLPAAALLLGGGILSARRRPAPLTRRSRSVTRLVLACGALLALPAIAIPLIGTTSIRSSQSDVRAGNLAAAMQAANSAQALEPYAATPRLQRALIFELERRYSPAAVAARQATEREPTDWQTWLVRSRIEVEADHPRLALDYYLRARALNPTSSLFSS
jgi:hypothetical protein